MLNAPSGAALSPSTKHQGELCSWAFKARGRKAQVSETCSVKPVPALRLPTPKGVTAQQLWPRSILPSPITQFSLFIIDGLDKSQAEPDGEQHNLDMNIIVPFPNIHVPSTKGFPLSSHTSSSSLWGCPIICGLF